MKRLALSLLGGLAITIFYMSTILLVLYWTRNFALVRRLSYPIDGPNLVLVRIFPIGWFDPRSGEAIFLLLLHIICNAVLYSIPIYFLLWRFSIRGRKAVRVDPPPDPPLFVKR